MIRTIRRRRFVLPLAARMVFMGALAAPAAAPAMQVLDAADHGEIAAEISATDVNRIALAGDRIAKVVRSPDGFAVEHDAASGDLYIRPAGGTPGTGAAGFAPVTLFVGSEAGFTYRLTLTPAPRDSAQILIRNADAVRESVESVQAPGGGAHVAALVRLIRAVARREPLPGTEILAGGRDMAGFTLVETWRGPRYAALVLETDLSADLSARDLARSLEHLPGFGPLAALWLAPPGTGPSGGRLAVAVVSASGFRGRP